MGRRRRRRMVGAASSSSSRGGFFGFFRRGGSPAAPKSLDSAARGSHDDAEKAMLAQQQQQQRNAGPAELETGPDVPEMPTAVNYQELAAGDPFEQQRAFEAQQMYTRGGSVGGMSTVAEGQPMMPQELLGKELNGAGVSAGGGVNGRSINYVNMNRKPVAAGGMVQRGGSNATTESSSAGTVYSPISPARTASQSHSEPLSSISPMSSVSPMMPAELPGDAIGRRRESG
ncbi:hypothetical protein B0J12DRAFT_663095 [Macrophomina phaseolina]|uniref:Uncharacterized protein n=1 Tax=Macrophomina phaseolina TaxID=35725 RepID=A0ABQ8GB58_9PEZI|nr:hypothetical protein B0J12DRAFT_663095 [Macrophomina phaseolina]